MKRDEHIMALKEHIRNLEDCIERGLVDNQRNIGYNASQGSIELFSIYMHHLNLVGPSSEKWDHRIFKSLKKMKEAIPYEFPQKVEILSLMTTIEEKRNILCYGKRRTEKEIRKVIVSFQEIKRLILREMNLHDI